MYRRQSAVTPGSIAATSVRRQSRQFRQSRQVLAPHAMATALALAMAAWSIPAMAQVAAPTAKPTASAAAQHRFSLPAGPLAQSLNTLAQQAGVQILYAAELASGKQAAALEGSHSVADALARLLAGTGLKAAQRDSRTWSVVAVANTSEQAGALPTVSVVGAVDSTTDGSHSYTTGVTSTATGMNLSIRETPQSISVVTRQRIEDQALNSMTDVLNQVPGITMSQDGQRYNVYARGSAVNTYQIDGVTTTQDNQSRTMPATLLDMALYDHVEVVRGATGLMTGAGEPGGVINLIRKKPTREFQAYVQASAGSWDTYRTEADLSGALNEAGSVRGRVVAAKQSGNSFIDHYQLDKDIFYGVVEADLGSTTLLRLSMDYQKFKPQGGTGVPLLYTNGVPTSFSRSTTAAAEWNTDTLETTNYTAALEQKLGQEWKLKMSANYMDVDRHILGGNYNSSAGRAFINQATGATTMQVYRATAHQVQRGVDLNLNGPFTLFGRRHEFIAGFNYIDFDNQHRAYDITTPTVNFYTWNGVLAQPSGANVLNQVYNVTSRQSGGFAATRLNLADGLNLFMGSRLSNYDYSYYLQAPATNYLLRYTMRERNRLTPYAGLTYDLSQQQTLYGSYADIFQPQSSQDRYGQPLAPVVGKNFELGWKGEFANGRVNANTALYRIKRDNVAVLDTGYTVPGSTSSAYRSVNGAITEGIDLELSGELARGWNVQTSFSHSTTKDASGARTLTYMPSNTVRLWSTYNLPGEWSRLTVGGGLSWNSDTSLYFSTYNATVRQDAYTVVNLMARYRFDRHWVATLNLNNLFDKTYYSGMAGSYGHYGDPRNAMLTLRYDF